MKNKLIISNLRKMKSSYKRFISLIFLSLLGVGFFCGIKGASPNMMETLDRYYKEYNVYDIEIISSLGFTSQDIDAIKDTPNIKELIGIKSIDVLLKNNKTLKVTSLSNINQVELLEGNMPTQINEILIEEKMAKEQNLKVGSFLKINDNYLKDKSYEVVGIIKSPLYFSSYRGTTDKGNGELNYYSYVQENAFTIPFFTSVEVTLQNEFQHNSKEYINLVNNTCEDLKNRKPQNQAEWICLDLMDNPTYMSFVDATESLKEIGSVFPLLFFFVSVLISLISMTRMVMEERSEIGILKALGFSRKQIMSRYIVYATLATSIGGILGSIIGFQLIPNIIWSIYTALFQIPNFISTFNIYYACIGIGISLLCILVATIISAYKILQERPSELMRPASPKPGKKIVLEKFSFLWRMLRFSNKVTIRNIFRYKRRVFVTMVGITGATALILVGFGVKDSVENIVEYNYNKIFIYDSMIRLKNEESDDIEKVLKNEKTISSYVKASYEYLNLTVNDKKKEINLIVPEDNKKLTEVIKLNDVNHQKNEITLEDGSIVLSEKLSKILNVKIGDEVIFDNGKKIKVSHIVENYINDYAYMTKNTYSEKIGSYKNNVIFIKQSEDYEKSFDQRIQKNKDVSNFIHKKVSSNLMEKVLSSLNSVVMVLISSSAILAFVILYNISTINISERKREISTLKVLGFYDEEVDQYITKENYLISIVGILLGLIFGLFLSYYVISTCEPDNMMFLREVKPLSYALTFFISFLFTIIMSVITHFHLKKIDMVESLKSIE